jgi:flagellar biosynthesis chaperone FliJ
MEYPLEQLATIKQKKLEEAERVLQEKKKALEKEKEKLTSLEKERDKAKDHRLAKLTQLREKLDAGTATDKIQQMKHYMKVVDEQLKQREFKVKEQQKLTDAASALVDTARKEVVKKHQEVEKLRLHRLEWEKEMKTLLEYKEGVESDEIGSAMHSRRHSKSSSLPHFSKKKK